MLNANAWQNCDTGQLETVDFEGALSDVPLVFASQLQHASQQCSEHCRILLRKVCYPKLRDHACACKQVSIQK